MLPQLPTDNLYKFIAIGGLFLVCLFSYLLHETNEELRKQTSLLDEKILVIEQNDFRFKELAFELKEFIKDKVKQLGLTWQTITDSSKIAGLPLDEELRIWRDLEYRELLKSKRIKSRQIERIAMLDRYLVIKSNYENIEVKIREAEIDHRKLSSMVELSRELWTIYLIVIVLGLILASIGFKLWYVKKQQYEDKMLRDDLKSS